MESNTKHGRVNFKMAGDGWQLIKGVKLIVEFAKILRVYEAGTLRNRVQRIRKW